MSDRYNDGIDWGGLRAASVTLGIRKAARNAATGLSPKDAKRFVDRIRKRAQREGWSQDKAKALAVVKQASTSLSSINFPNAVSPVVASGAESVAIALAEDNKRTRLGLSSAACKAAQTLSQWDGEKVIDKSEDLKRIVSSAAQIHEWDAKQSHDGPLNLAVLGQAVIQVNQ
jgi:hypothetical protein